MENRLFKSYIWLILSFLFLASIIALAYKNLISYDLTATLIEISVTLVFISAFHVTKADFEISLFECQHCNNIFKPTFKSYIFGAHTTNFRYLKCPKCEKKSWCRREHCNNSNLEP